MMHMLCGCYCYLLILLKTSGVIAHCNAEHIKPSSSNAGVGFIKYTATDAPRYLRSIRCEWLINGRPDQTISVWFELLSTEKSSNCSKTAVLIEAFNNNKLLNKYCGSLLPKSQHYSHFRLRLKFISNFSRYNNTFIIRYRYVNCQGRRCSSLQFPATTIRPPERSTNTSDTSSCGIAEYETNVCDTGSGDTDTERIYKGIPSPLGSWPWMASISVQDIATHWCGATLIGNQWLLSAAHCFIQKFNHTELIADVIDSLTVRLGVSNLWSSDPATESDSQVNAIIIHPRYDPSTNGDMDHDIALIKLMTPVNFTQYIRAICLPNAVDDVPAEGSNAMAAGWGEDKNYEFDQLSALQAVCLPILSEDVCRRLHTTRITGNMLCAGYVKGGPDTCGGDSGGPLIQMKEDGSYQQIAIVSWGVECGQPNRPGVYTLLAPYLDWIHEMMDQYGDDALER